MALCRPLMAAAAAAPAPIGRNVPEAARSAADGLNMLRGLLGR